MEKPPIDPILKKQYDDELAKCATDAARRALMAMPDEALMTIPDQELIKNPDRLAEENTAKALQNPETQTWLNNGDQVASQRSVREERELNKYAKENGKNVNTYVGPIFRGTTENLVGDSKNSVFTKFEDYMIKSNEQIILDSADKIDQEYVDKLPHGNPMPSVEEMRMLKERPGGLFADEPFDQDKAA